MRKLFNQKTVLTHSSMQTFRDCRTKYKYRYQLGIVPTEPEPALVFGSAIHAGLEFWFKYGTIDAALEIFNTYSDKLSEEDAIKGRCLLQKYVETYSREEFEVVEIEKPFNVALLNPSTGRISRIFELAGKIDGLVKTETGAYYILEHKTAADISDAYKRRILIDTQIALYATAIERAEHISIKGAIYDVIKKPRLIMKKGETESEFKARQADLIAKNKSGRSTAKKQEAETAEQFAERVTEAITPDYFQRFVIDFSLDQKTDVMKTIWAQSRDMINMNIYRNTGKCAFMGVECPYLELCRHGGDLESCGDVYTHQKPHSELEV